MKSLYIMLGISFCAQSFAIERYMVDGDAAFIAPQKKIQMDELPQIKALENINESSSNTAAIPAKQYMVDENTAFIPPPNKIQVDHLLPIKSLENIKDSDGNTAAIPPKKSLPSDSLMTDDRKNLLLNSGLELNKELDKELKKIAPPDKTGVINLTNISNGIGMVTTVNDLYKSTNDCISTSIDKTESTQACAKIAYDGYQVVKNGVVAVADYTDAALEAAGKSKKALNAISKLKVLSNNTVVHTVEGVNSLTKGTIAAYDPFKDGDYLGATQVFIEEGKPFQTGLGMTGGAALAIFGPAASAGGLVVGDMVGESVDISISWAIGEYQLVKLLEESRKDSEERQRRKIARQVNSELMAIELQREQDKMRSEAKKQHDDMIFMQQVVMPAMTAPVGGTAETVRSGEARSLKCDAYADGSCIPR